MLLGASMISLSWQVRVRAANTVQAKEEAAADTELQALTADEEQLCQTGDVVLRGPEGWAESVWLLCK